MERKLLITISVGLFLIILISFFLLFGLKVRFLISEELRVELTPSSIHLETQRDPRKAQVEITTHTFFQCTARCEYELRDLSKNKTLKKSSVLFDKHTNEQLSFTLEPPQRGEGINYYSFDMQCQNIRSSLCLTQEKPILKTALITLNYTYTQDERIAKTFLEDVLPRLAQNISQADARLNASINLLKKVDQLEESKQLILLVKLRFHVKGLVEKLYDRITLHPLGVFFFGVYYIQSKINQKQMKKCPWMYRLLPSWLVLFAITLFIYLLIFLFTLTSALV
jgi:hypothetical protein